MAEKPKYTRKNPYIARMKKAEVLTAEASEKDTRHFEIDLAGSGMEYEPGDSLAVLPTNCPALVDDVIKALGATGKEMVTAHKEEVALHEALLSRCVITLPDKKFLTAFCGKAGDAAADLEALLAPEKKKELADHLWGLEIIDFLLNYPTVSWEPQEFVALLKKLNVRLYSIASSLKAHPEEVHLTVATVTYDSHGRSRKGVCSTFLAERISDTTEIPCFITPGKGFRLPEPDDATPVIMVGPGTGIAPFRAFVEERRATKAQGKAWLFFGEQRESTDFLYSDEWKSYLEDGTLARFDTAFSRDQDHKIYVQHRILEHAEEMWKWLEEEQAIFYVCGDAARMAGDVDQALRKIVAEQGGKSEEEVEAWMEAFAKEKRYRRDVY